MVDDPTQGLIAFGFRDGREVRVHKLVELGIDVSRRIATGEVVRGRGELRAMQGREVVKVAGYARHREGWERRSILPVLTELRGCDDRFGGDSHLSPGIARGEN